MPRKPAAGKKRTIAAATHYEVYSNLILPLIEWTLNGEDCTTKDVSRKVWQELKLTAMDVAFDIGLEVICLTELHKDRLPQPSLN